VPHNVFTLNLIFSFFFSSHFCTNASASSKQRVSSTGQPIEHRLLKAGFSNEQKLATQRAIQEAEQNAQLASLPFRPAINPWSSELGGKNRVNLPIEDALLTWGTDREHRQGAAKNQHLQETLPTFQPTLDPVSRLIADHAKTRSGRNVPTHLALHQEHRSIAERRQQLIEEQMRLQVPAKPEITPLAQSLERPADLPIEHRLLSAGVERMNRRAHMVESSQQTKAVPEITQLAKSLVRPEQSIEDRLLEQGQQRMNRRASIVADPALLASFSAGHTPAGSPTMAKSSSNKSHLSVRPSSDAH
jgi:hypothetical protein